MSARVRQNCSVVLLFVLFVVTIISLTIAQKDIACSGVQVGNFVRNSGSCQSYYYCNGQAARSGQCPPTFFFNAKTQVCDLPSYVDCSECSPFGIQHLEDPLSCSHYYRCVNGQRSRIACASNLIFNVTIGECSIPESSDYCSRSICAPYATYVKVGDPNDCT